MNESQNQNIRQPSLSDYDPNIHPNSIEAWEKIRDSLPPRQQLIFNTIMQSKTALTDKEIARLAHLPIESVTGRRGELEKKGVIECAGNTLNERGNKASLWRVARARFVPANLCE
jgi:hypothetical protein